MTPERTSVLRTAAALGRSTHPGPSAVVTAIAVILGVAAGLEPWRIVVLGGAILFGQLSVGLSNDAFDAHRDRETGRADKPLARGEASVRAAWTAAAATLVGSLALSAILGIGMLVAHLIALAAAWAYNAGLKSTPFSVAPFVVSFGLLPSLVTLAAVPPRPAAAWAWIAGAAIGVAVHVTNVLPDLDDDARTGVRGLPHRLGRTAGVVVAATALVAGAVAVLVGPLLGPFAESAPVSPFAATAFALAVALVVAGLVLGLVRRPGRWVFRLVMLAALLLCVQLAASGQSLLG